MAYNKGLNQTDKDRINQGMRDMLTQGKTKEEALAWRDAQVEAAKANVPVDQTDAPQGQPSTELASESGSSGSQESENMGQFSERAGKKRDRVDEDGEVINLAKDFGEVGAFVESIPFFGDLIDDIYGSAKQGWAQGQTVDDALALFGAGADVDEETLQKYIAAVQNQQNQPVSKETEDFDRVYEEAGGGAWGFIKAIALNPSVAATTITSSMVAMLNPASAAGAGVAAATGAGAGAAFFGVGAGVGAVSGAFAGAGAILETGSSFTEFLQEEIKEKGLEGLTEENVMAVLEDEDALLRIRGKSAARGGIIGLIDGFTGGVAGKAAKSVASTAKRAAKLKSVLAATAVEGAGGGIGETAARLAVGQELDAKEIGLEIVGEFGVGVGIAKAATSQPAYEINGQRVNKKQVDALVASSPELAASVKVENDAKTKEAVDKAVSDIDGINNNKDLLDPNENELREEKLQEVKSYLNDANSTNDPIERSEFQELAKESRKELKEIVKEQDAKVAELSAQDRETIVFANTGISKNNAFIQQQSKKYEDKEMPPHVKKAIDSKRDINVQLEQELGAVRANQEVRLQEKEAKKQARAEEKAAEEAAEEQGITPDQVAAVQEQKDEVINEDVTDNQKKTDDITAAAINLDSAIEITDSEGSIPQNHADEYIPLSKSDGGFTKGDFQKQVKSTQPVDPVTAKRNKIELEQEVKKAGFVPEFTITTTPDGLMSIEGTITAPKRDTSLAEQFQPETDVEAEVTEQDEVVELSPEDTLTRAQEIATEKGKKYNYEGPVESTKEGDLNYPGVYATREQADALGKPYDTAATGVIKRTQRRLINSGYPQATYEVTEEGTKIVKGPFDPKSVKDEFSIGKSEGQLRLQQQAAKVGSGPQKSKKQYTRKRKHKGKQDEFSLSDAPENTVVHQDLRGVSGERVQMNIGLENNPLGYDAVIKKLQENPKVRLGTTEKVVGEYDGQPENTLVVDAKYDGKAKDFRDYINSLANDLTQNSIAVKYNGRGALVEKTGYKEQYSFSDEFFKQPSTLTGAQQTGRQGALSTQDIEKLGINPDDLIVKAGEGQSYIKIPLTHQTGTSAELAGGKGGFSSGGDARESIGQISSGEATQTAADFQQMLQDAVIQAPATLTESERNNALEVIRKIAKQKGVVDTGKKTRPKSITGKAIPGEFTEAAQVSHPLGNVGYGLLNSIHKSITDGEPMTQARLDEYNKAYDQLMGYKGAHQNLNNEFRIGIANDLNLPNVKAKPAPEGSPTTLGKDEVVLKGGSRTVDHVLKSGPATGENVVLGKDVQPSKAKKKSEGGEAFDSAFDRRDLGDTTSPREDIRGKGIKGEDLVGQAATVLSGYNDGSIDNNQLIEKFTDYLFNKVPRETVTTDSDATFNREESNLQGIALGRLVDQVDKGNFKGLDGKAALRKVAAIARSAKTEQKKLYGTNADAQRAASVVRRAEQAYYAENGIEPSLDELSEYINDNKGKYKIDITPEGVEAAKFEESTFGQVSEFGGVQGDARDRAQTQIARDAGLDQLSDAVLSSSQRQRIDNAVKKILGESPEVASTGEFAGQTPRRGAGFKTKGDVAAKRVKETNTRLDKFVNEGIGEILTTGVLKDSFRELSGIFGYPEGTTFESLTKNEKRDLKRKVAKGIAQESENRIYGPGKQERDVLDEFSLDTTRGPEGRSLNPNHLDAGGPVHNNPKTDLHGLNYEKAADKVAFWIEDHGDAMTNEQFREFAIGKNPDKFKAIKADIEDYYPKFEVNKHPNGSGEFIITKKGVNPTDVVLSKGRGRVGDADVRDFTTGKDGRTYTGFDKEGFGKYIDSLKSKVNPDTFITLQRFSEENGFPASSLQEVKDVIRSKGLVPVETTMTTSNGKKIPVLRASKRGSELSLGTSTKDGSKAAVKHLEALNPGVNFVTDKATIEKVVERSGHKKSIAHRIKGAFTREGDVVLNMDNITPDTPFHEVGHGWLKSVANSNPEFYAKGESLARNSETYKRLKNDSVYGTYPEHRLLEEVMATDIGNKGAEIFNDKRNATRWDNWVKKAKKFVATALGMDPKQFEAMTYADFIEGAAADIATSENVLDYGRLAPDEYSIDSDPNLDSDISDLKGKSADSGWFKSPSRWLKALVPPSADDYHGLVSKIIKKIPGIQKVTDAYTKAHHEYVKASTNVRAAVDRANKALGVSPIGRYKGTVAGTNVSNYQAIQAISKGYESLKSSGVTDSEIAALKKFAADNGVNKYIADMTEAGVFNSDNKISAANPANDLVSYITNDLYKKTFEPFVTEKNKVFTKEQMNKIKGEHGIKYHGALENSLQRMTSGKTGTQATTKIGQAWHDFLQGSVGVTMFWNFRSAALQMLSTFNYALESDTPLQTMMDMFNPANKKLAMELYNNPYLKERRKRAGFDVNANEMFSQVSSGEFGKARSKLLNWGFKATSTVDSMAIAWGGAAFVKSKRASINKKTGKKFTKDEAISAWIEQTEEAQQSSRPDRVSQMQTEGISKFILAFANTPQQYFRLAQKATREIRQGKNVKKNVAKIAYYMAVQNAMFTALQSASMALFSGLSGDDEQDKEALSAYNSMMGTVLRGMGLNGAALDAAKNVIMEAVKQEGKANPDHVATALKAISISPPLNRKIQDLIAIGRSHNFDSEDKWVTTAARAGSFANLPTDWVQKKGNAVGELLDDNYSKWQSLLQVLGWSPYQFDAKDDKDPFGSVDFGDVDFGDVDFGDEDLDF